MDFRYPKAHEIVQEYLRQLDLGADVSPEDVIRKHQHLEKELHDEFRNLDLIENVVNNNPSSNNVESDLVRSSSTSQVDIARKTCLLYTSPSPRDLSTSRMPSSA